jgi:NADH dehydrogenase
LETWLGLIGGPLVAQGKTLVFGRGQNPINFVSALDVARFVDLAIADRSFRGKVVEVPGPENLTLDQLVEITRAASGRSGHVSHSPRRHAPAVDRASADQSDARRADRGGAPHGHA